MTEVAKLPKGMHNALWFSTFNALSFPLVIGSPMILYAKTLGASATILGIIAGMMPLLVIFQIPAAKHVHRVGYKRFVHAGWSVRVMIIGAIALVPLTGWFLNPVSQLSLILALLFAFNLSRGISSCAWLPWITSLVPLEVRGRYLSWDAACVNLASFVITAVAAAALWEQPAAWSFAILFALSAAMGAVSLTFLKRIPEVETPEEVRASNTPVPWGAIAGYNPFRRLLWAHVAWSVAYGGVTTFTVAWLKTEAAYPERDILLVTSLSFLGGLSSLWWMGSRMDRLGSKPLLSFSMAAWMVIMGGWTLLAGDALSAGLGWVVPLQFMMGLFASMASMAFTRLAMAVTPPMGRSHFFALYSVVGNLTLGISPVVWGIMLDALSGVRVAWHGFQFNRYSLFFGVLVIVYFVAEACCRRLEEPKAVSMDKLLRELLVQSPLRIWVRFWPR